MWAGFFNEDQIHLQESATIFKVYTISEIAMSVYAQLSYVISIFLGVNVTFYTHNIDNDWYQISFVSHIIYDDCIPLCVTLCKFMVLGSLEMFLDGILLLLYSTSTAVVTYFSVNIVKGQRRNLFNTEFPPGGRYFTNFL